MPVSTPSNSKRGIIVQNLALTLLGLAVGPLCFAADAPKVKVLESGKSGDLKSLNLVETKVKVVSTRDADHTKVIEAVMDYAKPGVFPSIGKGFAVGELKKYSAVRFWVRSDFGTGFAFSFNGDYKRKDGRGTVFSIRDLKGGESWTQITIPIEKIKRNGIRTWDKDKKVWVEVPGGDSMDDQDLAGISRWSITSAIERRGTSTVGHLMFDSLELVEK